MICKSLSIAFLFAVDKLRDTVNKLRGVKILNQGKRNLGLVEDCEEWFDDVKNFIKASVY
jgi:hypothetical protein